MKNTTVSADARASTPGDDGNTPKNLPLRERYLLERERIQHEIGGLDRILETLGVSQRRACQLLLVDPSAWTRWNKTEAPPHIYQALRWLIQLKKTNPEITGPSDVAQRLDVIQASTQAKLREIESNVAQIERALTYTPVADSRGDAVVEERLRAALQAQEERFQRTILELQAKLDRLTSRKAVPAPKATSQKKASKKTASKKSATAPAKERAKTRSRKSTMKSKGGPRSSPRQHSRIRSRAETKLSSKLSSKSKAPTAPTKMKSKLSTTKKKTGKVAARPAKIRQSKKPMRLITKKKKGRASR